jgi:hypothetical protein
MMLSLNQDPPSASLTAEDIEPELSLATTKVVHRASLAVAWERETADEKLHFWRAMGEPLCFCPLEIFMGGSHTDQTTN